MLLVITSQTRQHNFALSLSVSVECDDVAWLDREAYSHFPHFASSFPQFSMHTPHMEQERLHYFRAYTVQPVYSAQFGTRPTIDDVVVQSLPIYYLPPTFFQRRLYREKILRTHFVETWLRAQTDKRRTILSGHKGRKDRKIFVGAILLPNCPPSNQELNTFFAHLISSCYGTHSPRNHFCCHGTS